jgi:hypothetical protein
LSFTQLGAQTSADNVNAILQRSSAAMGCTNINATTNITVIGHLQPSSTATSMLVTISSQGNSRWRSELDTPKGRKVTVVNDGKGQIQHADGRTAPLAENNTSHQRPMHIPCLTNVALPTGAVDATYLRTEPAESDSLDVIEILPMARPSVKAAADRMKAVVWISRANGYLVKLQYSNAAEQDSNDTQIVVINYSDYRLVGGVAVPFHQLTLAGNLTLDLKIDSVQLNTPAADFSLR